jgi:small multidrug resistance pump
MPKRALQQEAVQPRSALRLRGGGGAAMSTAQGWSVLFAATVFELVSTIFMDKAEGFSKPLPSVVACVFYAASFYGFNLSLRALETSVAYAVWSAVVMAALSVVGIVFLNESKSWLKFSGVTTIIFGTICLSCADTA